MAIRLFGNIPLLDLENTHLVASPGLGNLPRKVLNRLHEKIAACCGCRVIAGFGRNLFLRD
jgi:hypothetical protein